MWGGSQTSCLSPPTPLGVTPRPAEKRTLDGMLCSPTLSIAWPPKSVEREKGHGFQGVALALLPNPLLSQAGDHLLSGPGPVAREKPLSPATMNDTPTPQRCPLPTLQLQGLPPPIPRGLAPVFGDTFRRL